MKNGTRVKLSQEGAAARVTEMSWWRGTVLQVDGRTRRVLVKWPDKDHLIPQTGAYIQEPRHWWEYRENITEA